VRLGSNAGAGGILLVIGIRLVILWVFAETFAGAFSV
jgi:hypothetical protein